MRMRARVGRKERGRRKGKKGGEPGNGGVVGKEREGEMKRKERS